MYKEDLILNNLQWLICHKTKPNQTKPKTKGQIMIIPGEMFAYSFDKFIGIMWCHFQESFEKELSCDHILLQGLEYDSIHCREVRSPTQQQGVLDITQMCSWCLGSSSGNLGSEEYPFIVITPRSTFIQRSGTCYSASIGQIDLFENYLYLCICTQMRHTKRRTKIIKTVTEKA